MKRKTGLLASIFIVLSIISFVIVKVAGTSKVIQNAQAGEKEETVILTSFYPMYILALNLVDGVDGVRVINLTENQTGCVHDYQLTTKDMREIANADIVILNGGEMEEFMEGVIENYPELKVINASEGMDYLKGISHNHNHEGEEEHAHEEEGHEDTHEEDAHTEDPHEEGEHHHSDINGHVWMNMDLYEQQINTVAAKLSKYDATNSGAYKKNAEIYINKVNELEQEFSDLKDLADGKEIIIFHDAFAYLAQQLDIEVVSVVNTDSESALSAGELAEVVEEIKLHDIQYLFTEAQYSTTVANGVASETDAKVYVMDSLVTGAAEKNVYLDGMRSNLVMLREAFMTK